MDTEPKSPEQTETVGHQRGSDYEPYSPTQREDIRNAPFAYNGGEKCVWGERDNGICWCETHKSWKCWIGLAPESVAPPAGEAKACKDDERLPITEDPSWWVKHWESGEDLHFNDDYMGTYFPTPNTKHLTIKF